MLVNDPLHKVVFRILIVGQVVVLVQSPVEVVHLAESDSLRCQFFERLASPGGASGDVHDHRRLGLS